MRGSLRVVFIFTRSSRRNVPLLSDLRSIRKHKVQNTTAPTVNPPPVRFGSENPKLGVWKMSNRHKLIIPNVVFSVSFCGSRLKSRVLIESLYNKEQRKLKISVLNAIKMLLILYIT